MTSMAYDFNAKDIFEMAIQIESNGASFYREAASLRGKQEDKDFFEALARMEERHMAIFEEMIKQVSESEKEQAVFDPYGELSLYLKAMADSHGGEGNIDIAALLEGKETIKDIITIAIDMEKESILFYIGLKDMVPPESGRDKIDHIINEEKKHVVQLSKFLKVAQKTKS